MKNTCLRESCVPRLYAYVTVTVSEAREGKRFRQQSAGCARAGPAPSQPSHRLPLLLTARQLPNVCRPKGHFGTVNRLTELCTPPGPGRTPPGALSPHGGGHRSGLAGQGRAGPARSVPGGAPGLPPGLGPPESDGRHDPPRPPAVTSAPSRARPPHAGPGACRPGPAPPHPTPTPTPPGGAAPASHPHPPHPTGPARAPPPPNPPAAARPGPARRPRPLPFRAPGGGGPPAPG